MKWETKKLGDVCDFEGGSQPPKSEFVFEEKPGYVRFLQIRDFGSDKNLTYIPHSKKNRVCTEDDILIGRYGASVGKILTGLAGAYNVALIKTMPNFNVLDRSWFHNYLLSDNFQEPLLNVAARSAQAGFSKDDIFNFPVPVPPLPEQQRIVGILDEAFAGIATAKANAEKNLRNARALFATELDAAHMGREADSWPLRRLGDVFEIGSSKRIHERDWSPSGVPFYGGKEIVKLAKYGEAVSNAYISEKKYGEYAAKYDMPKAGDILITARGTIGVGYVVRNGDKFYYKDGNIISMRAKEPTSPHFLLNAFRSNALSDQLGELSGTTVRHLPIEKCKELRLRMPSFTAQNKLIERLERFEVETDRLESLYQQKLAALDALKKSLLHQAFSGELGRVE